jgi:intein-encoded DNA endonuclease-like protein
MKKEERQRRRDFIKNLVEKGYSYSGAVKAYDKKFGTHYSRSFLTLSIDTP